MGFAKAALLAAGLVWLGSASGAMAQKSETVVNQLIAAHRPGEAYSITVEGSRGKGVMQLEATAYGLLTTDAKNLGEKGWGEPWATELDRLHVSTGTLTDTIAILATRGLVVDRKITRENFDRYVSRLKEMSPDLVERWKAATTTIQPGVSGLVLVGLLVAHDPLFDSSGSIDTREARELKRLQSIPVAAINAWRASPAIDSAFELLRVDSLFVGDLFSSERFERALPLAKERLAQNK
jgi:hypothetical protein